MNAGQDKPQEATSPHGETPGAFTGRLPALLAAHQHWVQTGGKEGKRADLAESALGRASLRLVVLSDANLQGADLKRAMLANARLQGADLSFATGLTHEQLTSARLDTSTRLPVELKVPAPSPPAVH
jgi:hypothetical protein